MFLTLGSSPLVQLLQLIDGMKGVKHLVTMDYDDEDKVTTLKKLSKKHGIKLHTFAEILEKGAAVADKKAFRLPAIEPDHLSVIMYTSGTTGNPKGAMISHGNIVAMLATVPNSIGGLFGDDVYISYLPLAHIFERIVASALLFYGGRIGFYQGDVTKLTEDMQVLKPTIMAAAPRVLNRIYQRINDNVSSAGGLSQKLFKMGLKSKGKSISQHKNKGTFDFVFKRPKSVTGGSLRLVISGSAPLTPEVQSFVRSVLGCPVVQGYGLTETCAGCSVAAPDDVDCIGEVGPMIACCEVKLASAPELNYLAKDNKGEVWVRGPHICKGYYKDEDKTKEDFDEEGWFHTGDIGEFTSRGTLKIIDRKKNIFKLSQGEYVASEVLENIYLKSPFVDQIWVHGDSTQSTLVSVININQKRALEWADKAGVKLSADHPIKDLLGNADYKKAILTALADMARAEKRAGYEVIKRVHLIDYEFNAENDFATPTAKLKRPQLRLAFKAEIDAMYKEIAKEESAGGAAAAAKKTPEAPKKADSKTKVAEAAKKDDPKGKGKGKDKAEQSSSAEDSSVESSDAKPAKKPAAKPAKKAADSESDGDEATTSSEEKPGKKASAAPKKAAAKKSNDSSSEEVAAPAKAAKKAESSEESESSDAKPAKKTAAPAKKAADSSEESSTSEEAPKKSAEKPAKKAAESSSESSSESEEKPKKSATQTVASQSAKKDSPKATKKASSDSSDSGESTSEEAPPKKAASKSKK